MMYFDGCHSRFPTAQQAAESFCREWLFGDSGLVEAIQRALRFEIHDLVSEPIEENAPPLAVWNLPRDDFANAMRVALARLLRDLAEAYETEIEEGP